ncbi:hypothetical protein RR46_15106 [Papilio xuthus]|nr:hypothetical protein RR46_15106 [Papilio xuthus]
MKYLDQTIKLFKEGTAPFSQNITTVDPGEDVKDINFTLHENPDTEEFATESFNVEKLSKPFTLKATLENSKISLQVE